MNCPRCQHENPLQSRFCLACGAPQILPCGSCGADLPAGAKFCNQCGHAVPSSSVQPRFASPESYTPTHLAERILTSRSALEGERKQVTVLFCDVVDSSRLAEHLDPEGMHEVMDRTLRLMAEGVHRYEGTVNQFLGDGVMALFGAPVALEDHALRAVQAALAIRETVAGYSEQLTRERRLDIRLRFGLNTGLVVVGRIGDDLRMDYTAVGDTTHLAARMQTLAEPGSILVTEATHRLVEGYVKSEALGPVRVKGRAEAVSVHTVTGRRRRTRLEVRAERGLTQLAGRQRELGILRDCLGRAKAARGQVVGIVGEPGVGKSRLLHEFRKSLEGERVTWLEGQCMAYGQNTPYLPVLDLLRANFQIEEDDNPLQIQQKLRQGLRLLDPSLDPILPFLIELFGLPLDDDRLKYLDPKDKRQKVFEAIRTLTVVGSQRRPLVVIVEDIHWIDRSSEDYFAFLIESLTGMAHLLVTTHRPGYAMRWGDKTYYTQIALDVLADDEAQAMVAAFLGSVHVPPHLVRIVQERAEGNPLFVEEITSSLLERGVLVRANGAVHWVGDARVDVPATIQDIIGARIDRLEEPVKRTVQTAAVIGREFGLRLLTRVSEQREEVQACLDTLKRVELIHEKSFFPEIEYVFKHAFTQDVAYETLLAHRRKELHGAIGEAIEDLFADRLGEQVPILAYHYARSERADKAVEYTILAGDRAARLFSNAEARTYYEQALTRVRALPPSRAGQCREIDTTLKLAAVGGTRQDIEQDHPNLERARAAAEDLHDDSRLARVLYWLGRTHYVLADMQQAIEFAMRSLAIAERLGDDALAAPPVNLMGRVYWGLSDLARSAQMMERSAAQMRRLGNKVEESTAAGFAGISLGWMGEFERAFTHAEHGIQLAREIQNPFAEAAAYHYRGLIRDQRGEWAQALADYEEAEHAAERAGDAFRVYIVKAWAGRAHAMGGDPTRGRMLVDESVALAARSGTRFIRHQQKALLAACLLGLGEFEGVPRLCEEAIALAEEAGDKRIRALALRTLAEVHSFLDPPDAPKAERAILEAIRLLEETGARPELARTHVSYARLFRTWGEREKAREHLAKAIGMFRDMGMAWDLQRAEHSLREG